MGVTQPGAQEPPTGMTKRAFLRGSACLGAMVSAGSAWAADGRARAPLPQVTPVPGEIVLPVGPVDLVAAGYGVQEYFISGTATSYSGAADAEGRWTVSPAATAPYVTRIVVVRPPRPHFNGTVFVEWLNVSGGIDFPPSWAYSRREHLRSGNAYVMVSAQKVGVDGVGTSGAIGRDGQGLKQTHPERYGRLVHPGDAYSFDMYSQAGALIKASKPGGIMGDLSPRKVIAVGESQSAHFLTAYANAVDHIAQVYDGILLHSRGGSQAALDGAPLTQSAFEPRKAVRLRDDLRVPVLTFITEGDLMGLGYLAARQPDGANLRVWEIPGAAHADRYLDHVTNVDIGTASTADLAKAFKATREFRGQTLDLPFNNAPQHHYVLESAISHLRAWVNGGAAPPHSAQIALADGHLVLDENGNTRGGIRTPWLDVPTSKFVGTINSPAGRLNGSAEPFTAAQLAHLYPGGRADYMGRFTTALDGTIKAGFILPVDRAEILGVAEASYGV